MNWGVDLRFKTWKNWINQNSIFAILAEIGSSEFGSIWTTPWPDEKDLFLKLIIRINRKLTYEKLTFFLGKLYQKFFLFYNLVTHGILDTEFG